MTWTEAYAALKIGGRVRRPEWRPRYELIIRGGTFLRIGAVAWTPTVQDLDATDWVIL